MQHRLPPVSFTHMSELTDIIVSRGPAPIGVMAGGARRLGELACAGTIIFDETFQNGPDDCPAADELVQWAKCHRAFVSIWASVPTTAQCAEMMKTARFRSDRLLVIVTEPAYWRQWADRFAGGECQMQIVDYRPHCEHKRGSLDADEAPLWGTEQRDRIKRIFAHVREGRPVGELSDKDLVFGLCLGTAELAGLMEAIDRVVGHDVASTSIQEAQALCVADRFAREASYFDWVGRGRAPRHSDISARIVTLGEDLRLMMIEADRRGLEPPKSADEVL